MGNNQLCKYFEKKAEDSMEYLTLNSVGNLIEQKLKKNMDYQTLM